MSIVPLRLDERVLGAVRGDEDVGDVGVFKEANADFRAGTTGLAPSRLPPAPAPRERRGSTWRELLATILDGLCGVSAGPRLGELELGEACTEEAELKQIVLREMCVGEAGLGEAGLGRE